MTAVIEALIASRDLALAQRLVPLMGAQGCLVEIAASRRQLEVMLRGRAVVVMDATLCTGPGLELLAEIAAGQHRRNRAVFWLAASPEELVRALQSGADDAMLCSGSDEEFAARLSGLLRRIGQAYPVTPVTTSLGLTVDRALRRVTFMGQQIPLTRREFELLAFLVAWPDEVFTREELVERAWGPRFDGTVRTVDQHVIQVRAKLGQHAVDRPYIATVRGRGYCLSTGVPAESQVRGTGIGAEKSGL
ncbi:MAG: response regulator transcription factor [Meiothermus sp.]|nr:response regulator transcription factor [Meiothermus sp.]